MIIAKSTEKTILFYRDNGDIVLRERPYEPRLAKAAAKKSKTSQSTRPGKKS